MALRPRVLESAWFLFGAILCLVNAQPSIDFDLTLPGTVFQNITQDEGPAFPLIRRSFSTEASNFAVDWNVATQWTTRETQIWDRANRPFALVFIAMYQALRVNRALEQPVEPNALAAFKERYDELLRQELEDFSPSVLARAQSVAVTVASNLLSSRFDDGSQDAVMSLPPGQGNIKGTDIGAFQPVAGSNYQGRLINFGTFGGSNYQFANATPMILPMPVDQLPVLMNDPGPPDMESVFYDSNYKATFILGEDNSTTRSRYQTDSAYFWFQTANTAGYHGQWNQIALANLEPDASLEDTTELLAQLAVTTYDTFIIVYSSKVRWQRWRPITAIHSGDCHPGGPDFCHQPAPDWQPLLPTPNNPAYPSFIGGAAGAAESILNSHNYSKPFSIGSEAFSPSGRLGARLFTNMTQAALDCCNSRIYGGVELLPDALAGRDMGLQVGDYVVKNFGKLDPLAPEVEPVYAGLVGKAEAGLAALSKA